MVLLRQLLGDVLRRLRLRQGRTLREVSASARVSLGYLSEVERGQKEASSELLAAICGALNTPLSQVFREVSDNFALAELQNEPVLGIPREPGLRVPAEASVGLDGERGFAPISTMVPEQEFADGQGGFRRASGHVHDVTDMVSVLPVRLSPLSPQTGQPSRSASLRPLGPQTGQPSDRSAPQTQALGLSVRFRTISGRFPDTMSASVTCSSTARSLARSAIHTCCSGSATPG
jgi:transcriptional regulator with XRE-family HTH domain